MIVAAILVTAVLAVIVAKETPSRQPSADEKFDRVRTAERIRRRPNVIGASESAWGRWPQR